MSEFAIQVENLSKRYRIGLAEKRHDTLAGAAMSWLTAPVANFRQLRRLSRFGASGDEAADIVWALKDVSFAVKPGEVLGVIGRNGAGKSTLLKILSRITPPTRGRAVLNGRVSSLLEVGTGFHAELTGRENVYLNGTVLGMSRREIDRKFDEIVAFSGVETFIDTPVKRYSSGMKVRLAFSVAAHLEPEILLVDEVLAVGDIAFQKKCLGKMDDVAKSGRTVLFVSHNMVAVTNLCDQAIWLDGGHITMLDKVDHTVAAYLNTVQSQGVVDLRQHQDRKGSGRMQFKNIGLYNNGSVQTTLRTVDEAVVKLQYQSADNQPLQKVRVVLRFFDNLGQLLFSLDTYFTDESFETLPPCGTIYCRLASLPLTAGYYSIMPSCSIGGELADKVEDALHFMVTGGDFFGTGKMPEKHKHGSFVVSQNWWHQSTTS